MNIFKYSLKVLILFITSLKKSVQTQKTLNIEGNILKIIIKWHDNINTITIHHILNITKDKIKGCHVPIIFHENTHILLTNTSE